MDEAPRKGRLPSFDPEALDADARDVVGEIVGRRGRLPTPFRVWINSPALARRLAPLGQFLATDTNLTKAEVELAVLIAAQHVHARYVLAMHGREAVEAGLSESVVVAIEAGQRPDLSEARQRAVVDMMLALVGPGEPSQRVFGDAVAELGSAGVAEVIAVAGYFTAVGMAMKMYAVPVPVDTPSG
jgi:4-carboxymuconolactone decarboxylase